MEQPKTQKILNSKSSKQEKMLQTPNITNNRLDPTSFYDTVDSVDRINEDDHISQISSSQNLRKSGKETVKFDRASQK